MLYIWVPYFTVNKIMALSLNDGWQVQIFASHFPPLYYLRKHIGLTAEAPKKLREADGQFILAMFPHGTGSDFRVLLQGMLPELFPHFHDKIRSLAASVLFLIPFIRELTLLTGCIEASRHVADKAIKNGRTILVLPGGGVRAIAYEARSGEGLPAETERIREARPQAQHPPSSRLRLWEQ